MVHLISRSSTLIIISLSEMLRCMPVTGPVVYCVSLKASDYVSSPVDAYEKSESRLKTYSKNTRTLTTSPMLGKKKFFNRRTGNRGK